MSAVLMERYSVVWRDTKWAVLMANLSGERWDSRMVDKWAMLKVELMATRLVVSMVYQLAELRERSSDDMRAEKLDGRAAAVLDNC
jgi:hypothetical protein